MNKTKYPNISLIKFRNKTVFGLRFTVTVLVLQCFLYTHAFKMASCVTFLPITKLFFSISAYDINTMME